MKTFLAINRRGQITDKQIKQWSLQKATRTFARLQQHSFQFRNCCCSDHTTSAACQKDIKCLVASECASMELVWRLDPSVSSAKWSGLSFSHLPVIFNMRASKGICGDKTIKDGAALIWRGWHISLRHWIGKLHWQNLIKFQWFLRVCIQIPNLTCC